MPEDGHPAGRSFAQRLDALFHETRKPGSRKAYSVREVAATLGWSHTHLANLRSGRSADPRLTEIQALAGFFGVPIGYFIDDAAMGQREAQLQQRLLSALTDPAIKTVALRLADAHLSPVGATAILAMIEQVQPLEQAAQSGPACAPPAEAP